MVPWSSTRQPWGDNLILLSLRLICSPESHAQFQHAVGLQRIDETPIMARPRRRATTMSLCRIGREKRDGQARWESRTY